MGYGQKWQIMFNHEDFLKKRKKKKFNHEARECNALKLSNEESPIRIGKNTKT